MIVAGFGFRATATADSLRSALAAAGTPRLDSLAAPEEKAGAPCLTELAAAMGLPVAVIPAATLAAVPTPTQSPRVRALHGTGSVAEAAALAAAGHGARLIMRRQMSADRLATCAIAEGDGT